MQWTEDRQNVPGLLCMLVLAWMGFASSTLAAQSPPTVALNAGAVSSNSSLPRSSTPPVAINVNVTDWLGDQTTPVTLLWYIYCKPCTQPVTFSIVSGPAHGSATIGYPIVNVQVDGYDGGYTLIYIADVGYYGVDSFTYTATDANGTSTPATATIYDYPQNPTVNAGSLNVAEGTSASGTLSASTHFKGVVNLHFLIAIQPQHGTVQITNAGSGAFTYTPASGFVGTDSFSFAVNDGYSTSFSATETMNVGASGSNDPTPSGANTPTASNRLQPGIGAGGPLVLLLLAALCLWHLHARKTGHDGQSV